MQPTGKHLLILFMFKDAAAKFYEGCSSSIRPYRLCDGINGYVDAIIRCKLCNETLDLFISLYRVSVLGLSAEEKREASLEAQRRAAKFGNKKFYDKFWGTLVFAGIFKKRAASEEKLKAN